MQKINFGKFYSTRFISLKIMTFRSQKMYFSALLDLIGSDCALFFGYLIMKI